MHYSCDTTVLQVCPTYTHLETVFGAAESRLLELIARRPRSMLTRAEPEPQDGRTRWSRVKND